MSYRRDQEWRPERGDDQEKDHERSSYRSDRILGNAVLRAIEADAGGRKVGPIHEKRENAAREKPRTQVAQVCPAIHRANREREAANQR